MGKEKKRSKGYRRANEPLLVSCKNIKKAELLLKDMDKLFKVLKVQGSISRDEPLEKYYLKKYNIKLEHKKKEGEKYYICNKSHKELLELFTSN